MNKLIENLKYSFILSLIVLILTYFTYSVVFNAPALNPEEGIIILSVVNVTPLIFLIRSFILGFSLINKDKSKKIEHLFNILINVIGYIIIVAIIIISFYLYILLFIGGPIH